MAELVSIRRSQPEDIGEPDRDNNNRTETAVDNPVLANDNDGGLDSFGHEVQAAINGQPSNGQRLQGTTISFHDITYSVDTKVGRKKTKKTIVNGISGIFTPGMNAILGPTGCGKTTTLDILAERKDMSSVTGDIVINGARKPANFKRTTGYVVQHDILMGTLTVRENIYFSAALRLPSSVSTQEKRDKVDKLINELGLSKVADSKVGTELIRGISGGEKRRTGIGMELIITPQVLFLDEPTTGLDAATASSVMQLLHALSRKGNTIIFSIHQPRYSIFKLFDNICLLADGHTVYHGRVDRALGYFEEIGYVCEPHNNPPDFFLDVINSTKSEDCADDKEVDAERGIVYCMDLISKFKDSSYGQDLEKRVKGALTNMKSESNNDVVQNRQRIEKFATGYFTQLGIVGQRSVRSLVRNPQTSIVQVFVMAFLGLIVGAIYFQLDKDESGIQNRVGAFFFIIINMVFANLDSVELLLKERDIFIHETASGYYRVSVYFLAKIFGEFLPYRAFSAIIFATIAYWMVGFQEDAGKFFIFLLTVVQVSLTACSLCFMFSATFGVFAIANLMIAVAYVIMMVFGGLLINQESFGDWIGWLRYLSIFKYGLECVNINELDGLTFHSSTNITNTSNNTSQCSPEAFTLSGSAYLKQQGVDVDMLWWNQLILFAMTIFYCFLAYLQLRRVKKDK